MSSHFDESLLENMSFLRRTFFEAAIELGQLRDMASVRQRLLNLIFAITPADRAGVFIDHSFWLRNRDDLDVRQESHNDAVDQVMKTGGAFVSSDAMDRIICLPLVARGDCMGALYAESTDSDAPFDQVHRFLLTGVAPVVANKFDILLYIERLEDENSRLHKDLGIRHDLVGNSPAIAKLEEQIAKVAQTNSTVCIQGESGTGKELVARAIHRNSKRAERQFIALNCAAFQETLLESELFGHEKGAFTGATAQKKGLFESASGGTLFLDEVGELSLTVQAKLLRALQEREIQRIGGTRPIPVDIRLVVATNRDLDKAVARNEFRQDLYFRLKVVTITTPPLRNRPDDIPILARHFLEMYRKEIGRHVRGIAPEAETMLRNYHWPGNVRELQNVIQHAVVMGSDEMIVPDDLASDVLERGGSLPTFHEAVNNCKRKIITTAVERSRGDLKKAAAELGIYPTYMYRLLRNLNLDPLFRNNEES